ncbi:hypothetical protein PR202_ga30162 [Eleusine coracana subsp. coracana]|uniref:Transposase Tnp1/En/Spm-like domain-containing protein n=1 Tax=Eleusine coracana subsp. coracana TaxID=191504 RepID=A0AAV5DLK4_ELECO|nr:hypothetical protein PR202_ga30162 [Eleusine coracana subsp. coracana]
MQVYNVINKSKHHPSSPPHPPVPPGAAVAAPRESGHCHHSEHPAVIAAPLCVFGRRAMLHPGFSAPSSRRIYNWFMRTVGRKWKQFKAKIKKMYFKSDMNIEELPQCPDSRINDDEWKFLKEPRGYVRVMGLGPTPQDIGTPGLKCYKSTRLQMEILACKKVAKEKAALEQRVDDLQARVARIEEMAQHERASAEPVSQHGSNLHQHEIDDAARLDQGDEDYGSTDEDDDDDEDEDLDCRSPRQYVTQSRPRSEHDTLPEAKVTIVSTRPNTIVGGQILGREFCEVIVTCVLKRDAILPRPHDDMDTMADAKMMSIVWPYKKLKVTSKASSESIAHS